MYEKQNTGIDTRGMLPVWGGVCLAAVLLLSPWFSVPAFKSTGIKTTYTLWEMQTLLSNIGKNAEMGDSPMSGMMFWGKFLLFFSILAACFLISAAVFAYRKKGNAVKYVRRSFLGAILPPVIAFLIVLSLNLSINEQMGRDNTFMNISMHSYVQLTVFPYAQCLAAGIFAAGARYLLDAESSSKKQKKNWGKIFGMRQRTAIALAFNFIAIPFVIFLGIFFLNNRNYTFIAFCMVVLAMMPFCMIFESRRPKAREVVLIAVMAALAVAGRLAFFMVPQFKPVSAIVIITGASLGAEAGFLTGAVAGFVSNFFFGQGPWTPWQMFALGIIGFLAGILFGRKKEKNRMYRTALCIYGGIATFFIYGFLMDTSTVLYLSGSVNWKMLAGIYISGLPFNFIHGISTVVFLFVLEKPLERKLSRIQKKYGLVE